jgi:hypothetical protein
MQGFPNKDITKSQILDMVCVMRNFENNDNDNIEKWLQSTACELVFQHPDSLNAATKQKGEEGMEDENEGESSEYQSKHSTTAH